MPSNAHFVTLLEEMLARARSEVREVSTSEADEMHATFVDVRELDEFDSGAIPSAVHVPRGVLEMRADSVLPKTSAQLVVYCASGARSLLAAHTLMGLGHGNVVSLAGGFEKWRSEGRRVATGSLDASERRRFKPHLLLAEIGPYGQRKLLGSRVLVVGVGGLGSPAALYLAAAGVGTLGLVDFDVVDESNLQRQIIYDEADVGISKIVQAKAALLASRSNLEVVTHEVQIDTDNVAEIIDGYDVIVDASDNFDTRMVLDDASRRSAIPVVHASIDRFELRVTVLSPGNGPCYRCLVPTVPPAGLTAGCDVGVLSSLPGVAGSLQACEAIKVLLDIGEPLVGRMFTYDAYEARARTFDIEPNADCAFCNTAMD